MIHPSVRWTAAAALLACLWTPSAKGQLVESLSAIGDIGVAVDGWGEVTHTTAMTGTITLMVPDGATIQQAWFYTSYKDSYDPVTLGYDYDGSVPLPYVRLDGQDLDLTDPPLDDTGSRGLYRWDVTAEVQATRDATPGDTLTFQVEEWGDMGGSGGIPQHTSLDGHAIVAVYEHASAPPRAVVVMDGVLAGSASSLIDLTIPCAYEIDLGEEVMVSVSFQHETDGEQDNHLYVDGAQLTTTAGGSDDGFSEGWWNGLWTVGSFGGATAPYVGAPVGVDGDVINGTPPGGNATNGRLDDELYDISGFLLDGATGFQLQQTVGHFNQWINLAVAQVPVEYVDDDGDGYSVCEGDCDDTNAAVFPGAQEIACNGLDDDCDPTTTEDAPDGDGDGYDVCDPADPGDLDGFDADCDDGDAAVNPGEPETPCNGVDDDCDATTEDAPDGDSDGYDVCDPADPGDLDGLDADCDDGAAAVNPGELETPCNGVDDDCDPATEDAPDVDGDGHDICDPSDPGDSDGHDMDCDDGDADVYSGAPNLCDGIGDNDCDGLVDDNEVDNDGDLYAECAGDCDDGDATVNPGATEVCNGIDDDCDGTPDDGLPLADHYPDADGDGYGDPAGQPVNDCGPPSGYADNDGDCDDGDATVNPGATEICNGVDDDCNGTVDDGVVFLDYWPDVDGDGYGDAGAVPVNDCAPPADHVDNGGDCDDADAAVNPAADEYCDNVDNDCDGTVDEGDAVDATTWYADDDGDGYGDAGDTTTSCFPTTGMVLDDTDCDDGDPAVNPGATEVCNGIDDDCDGDLDEGFDADGDGFSTCDTPVADCDDGDAAVYPGATETCNGVDDDCNGLVDDGVGSTDYYPDADGDGYGDAAGVPVTDCSPPSGYVDNALDCDDGDAAVSPDATELCDGVDNDCDGTIDEDDAQDAVDWYADVDGDGYGDAADTVSACAPPTGYVGDDTDCDDALAAVNPGMPEICNNGVDDDCDPATDETVDDDGDGWSECDGDCDDSDELINPMATEVCDGVDNDCDPATDETVDGDLDGQSLCDGDCDDANDAIYTGAPELCDGRDNDCDGVLPVDEVDDDGDGSFLCDTPPDCDDADPLTFPGAPEQCDGLDNDCDGLVDEDVGLDQDGDGFNPCQGDCDDNDAAVFPGAPAELCDGKDTDCDGIIPADEVDGDLDGWLACAECDDADPALNMDDNDLDGYSTCDGDCNDFDDTLDPADADLDGYSTCDGDCDDADAYYNLDDLDLDGYSTCDGDCDDGDPTMSPGQIEVCDGADNDCDGLVDEETECYDDDGDGFTEQDGDCDDTDPDISPGADEDCFDGVDNDCDGLVDDLDEDDCGAGDDDTGDDDTGDDDTGDDDTGDDDVGDDDIGDDDTGVEDDGEIAGGCNCEGDIAGAGPAAALSGVLALAGLLALRRRR